MDSIYVVLICFAVVIILMFLPLLCNIRVYFNIGKNFGTIALSILGIPIFCVQFKIAKLAIDIIKSKGKKREVHLSFVDKNAILFNNLIVTTFRYLIIRELSIFVDVGVKNDAAKTMIYSGLLLSTLYDVYSILYTIKREFVSYASVNQTTQSSECKIAISFRFCITLFMLIVSFIRAKLRTNRTVNVYERFLQKRKSNSQSSK